MSSSDAFVFEVLRWGPVAITNTVVVTWAITLVLGALAWIASRHLRTSPARWQVALEGIVSAMEDAIRQVVSEPRADVLPFIGTLWIFIVLANLASLVPGVRSPTADLSLTAALAILVFLAVHWYGIRTHGIGRYLRHYLRPNLLLLPFHLLGELSRTVALAVRLFGNIFSLQMAALLVLLVAGLLAPVPVLLLHVIEALVQAYIFGMLALVYVAGALQSQQSREDQERSSS